MASTKAAHDFIVRDNIIRVMLFTLFSLIVADGLITKFLVANNHGVEWNPFLQVWVSQDLFLTLKTVGAILVITFLWIKYQDKPKTAFSVAVAALAFYTIIVYWNLFVLLNAQL